jgi:hypothetical protein
MESLSDDKIRGMKAIAHFVGEPERRCYYLAENGLLPGVFKQGAAWVGLKSKIIQGYQLAAERGAAGDNGGN